MQYREFPACDPLAEVLECLWTLEGHARDLGGEPQPVLPDGRTEIVLHFGDRFDRLHAGRAEGQAAIIFAGQLTEQLTLAPTGRIAVLGLRFRPHGAVALLGEPLHRLTGVVTALESIDGRVHGALRRVHESATSLADAARRAQEALVSVAEPTRIDPRVRHAAAMIERRRGQAAIDDVVRDSCTTRRHLERLFKDAVGVSPKRLSRIARFQHALRLLESADSPAPGTATAFSCGYADQAHFIRDFKDLAGCPPGEHLLHRTELTGLFIANR
jgi:AraC-like DNA-binding protein